MVAKYTIQIDTREQAPLVFPPHVQTERAKLVCADYGISGFSDLNNPAFIIERKSIDDLCGSLGNGRERFFRSVEKMRAFRYRALVIEGTEEQIEAGDYHSSIYPSSVLGSLDALSVRCDLHIFWCRTPTRAALKVMSLADKFISGIEKDYLRAKGSNNGKLEPKAD